MRHSAANPLAAKSQLPLNRMPLNRSGDRNTNPKKKTILYYVAVLYCRYTIQVKQKKCLRKSVRTASSSSPRDPWFGLDKLEHLLVSCFLTLAGSLFFKYAPTSFWRIVTVGAPKYPLRVAAFLTAVLGALKEAGDEINIWIWCPPCSASGKDFLADVVGIVIGSALYCAFLLGLERRRRAYARPSTDVVMTSIEIA